MGIDGDLVGAGDEKLSQIVAAAREDDLMKPKSLRTRVRRTKLGASSFFHGKSKKERESEICRTFFSGPTVTTTSERVGLLKFSCRGSFRESIFSAKSCYLQIIFFFLCKRGKRTEAEHVNVRSAIGTARILLFFCGGGGGGGQTSESNLHYIPVPAAYHQELVVHNRLLADKQSFESDESYYREENKILGRKNRD